MGNAVFQSALAALLLTAGAVHCAPPFEQRYFWTWDHRMEWSDRGEGRSVMGGGGRYQKTTEDFLQDYKRLIAFMADHGFNALVIWGFVRDSHGGVAASQELCRYARAKGVRICPGVGTSGYEGYVFEGNHQYNISTWLKAHPELRAIGRDGRPRNALCPTKPENIKWLNEGCRWLFKTFEIGGINFEIGDFFVCYCDHCRAARAAMGTTEADYYKDMAISTAPVMRVAHEMDPEAWLSYATYTGFDQAMMNNPPDWPKLLPEYAICQWTLTGMYRQWPRGLRPPTPRNIGYLHWANKSTHTQDQFYVARVREACKNASDAGFLGLSVYGEMPASRINIEITYRAFEFFMDDPDRSVEQFGAGPVAEMFGQAGAKAALGLVLELEKRAHDRELLERRAAECRKWAATAQGAAHRNWQRLAAFLEGQIQQLRESDLRFSTPEDFERLQREGLRLAQGARATIDLPPEFAAQPKLSFQARMDFPMEDGFLATMALRLNGRPIEPKHALDRPAEVAFPHHQAYKSLPTYDPEKQAWYVKYDNDFEIKLPAGSKYETPGYTHQYQFDLGSLAAEGKNVLVIENLERRWWGAERGRLVIESFQVGGR